jgi:hypothetical protein
MTSSKDHLDPGPRPLETAGDRWRLLETAGAVPGGLMGVHWTGWLRGCALRHLHRSLVKDLSKQRKDYFLCRKY